MSEFEEFARSASAPVSAASHAPSSSVTFDQVAILGGGADARLIAALCLSEGARVTLFSAYGAELEAMNSSAGITLRGEGPIGTFQINQDENSSIQTTPELDRAVAGADVIFLTGPIHKQRTYAMVLADHLKDGQVLVLAPGRSMGALEAAWNLRVGGCQADITLVETQNLPYWIDEQGNTLVLSDAGSVAAATLPSNRKDVISALNRFFYKLEARDSVLASGFEDGSALVEIPALLMGGPAALSGAVNIPAGGQPLEENHTFASLIGEEHRLLIDKLVGERASVAKVFGVRNLPDSATLIENYAGTLRGPGSRRVPDKTQAVSLLRDGVIGSLVPLASAADLAGIEVPATKSLIVLTSTVLGADVAAAGRRLETIGIQAEDVEQARRSMDKIAAGHR